MSRAAAEKRGPKVGDAASLWNFTPSPGWTKEEAAILKAALCVYGVGRWVQIIEAKVLPGKVIQQLNGQTQRLLGQQSIAAFTGLFVDIDRVRADNLAKTDAERKSGLVINSGPNPTSELRKKWRDEAQSNYGLSKAECAEWKEVLEMLVRSHRAESNMGSAGPSLMAEGGEGDVPKTTAETVALLRRLRAHLKEVTEQRDALKADGGAGDGAGGMEKEGDMGQENIGPNSSKPAKTAVVPKRKRASSSAAGGGPAPRAPSSRGGRSRGPRSRGDGYDDDDMGVGAGGDGAEAEGGAAGGGFVDEGSLSQLAAMGFPRVKAVAALEETGGELSEAINWLFENCG